MTRPVETSAIDPAKKKDMPVMGALRQQKSVPEDGSRNSLEIIQEAIRTQAPGQDPNRLLAALAQKLKSDPNLRLLQIGDTVFMVQRLAPDTVTFSTFSSEPLDVLMKRYVAATKTLRSQGIKRVIMQVDRPGYMQVAQQVGQMVGAQVRAQGNQIEMVL